MREEVEGGNFLVCPSYHARWTLEVGQNEAILRGKGGAERGWKEEGQGEEGGC
jgi:hypothetical protein